MTEKIISILKTFSEGDVKDFKKFIASPYFSRGRNLGKYFESIMKFYPGFKIDKDKFLKFYFGKKDDSEGKQSKILRALNSDFAKSLDDYITADSLKQMKFYSNYLLIEGYSHRGLLELGEQKVEESISLKENLDVGFIKELQMILLRNLHSNFKGLGNKNSEIYDIVESESEELISFFFSTTAHFLNSLEVNAKAYKINKNTEQLSLLMENFNFENFLEKLRPDFPDYKKIKLDVILLCIMLNNKKFESLYLILNEIYIDAFDTLDMRDKMNYFTSVFNYYSDNPNENNVKRRFEFIKFGLSKNLFPSGEIRFMNAGTYKMFMLSALHAGEVDWAENYIKEYIEKINPDFKENMLFYANAYIAHYRKAYLKSLDEISKFKFDHEIFTYDMKLMQLKNYYELTGESELYIENLNYSIDAFNHFLKDNKKVSGSYRKMGKEFIAGLRLLMKCRFGNTKKDKEDIKFDIKDYLSKTKNMWLAGKMKEII